MLKIIPKYIQLFLDINSLQKIFLHFIFDFYTQTFFRKRDTFRKTKTQIQKINREEKNQNDRSKKYFLVIKIFNFVEKFLTQKIKSCFKKST